MVVRVRPGDRPARRRPSSPASHVHTHNLGFEELSPEYEFPAGDRPLPVASAEAPTFLGYPREDGRAGTRNYIAVVAASNCAAHTAELIAAQFRRRNAAAQRRWRGGVPARRRLRPFDRTRIPTIAAHARRRAGSPQRFGRDDSRAWAARSTRSSTTWPRRAARQPPGRA